MGGDITPVIAHREFLEAAVALRVRVTPEKLRNLEYPAFLWFMWLKQRKGGWQGDLHQERYTTQLVPMGLNVTIDAG